MLKPESRSPTISCPVRLPLLVVRAMTTPLPMRILRVDASARSVSSNSRTLADTALGRLAANGRKMSIVHRDLRDPVPCVDQLWVDASFTPPSERSEKHRAKLETSDTLVDELEDANLILINTPIYNFGMPAALKAWIDQVCRARRTFRYTESGPVGLLEDKRAIAVITSGGTAVGSEIDFLTPHLRHVLGFLGITDVDIIAADQLMHDTESRLEAAEEKLLASLDR